MSVLILFLVAIAAGLIAGTFGIGGGGLFVPAMIFFEAMDMHHAKATSLFAIIFVSAVASASHWRYGHVKVNYAIIMGVGGGMGGILGTAVSSYLPTNILEIIFGLFLIFSAIKIMSGNEKNEKEKESPRRKIRTVPIRRIVRARWMFFFIIGMIAGFVSGLIGIGGGSLMVPILILSGMPIHVVTGTSLLAIVIISSANTAAHYTYGYLEVIPAIILGTGGCLGAVSGAYISKRTPARRLKKAFSVILILLGTYFLYRCFTF